MKRFLFITLSFFIVNQFIFSQEALKSAEEDYYDFLSLTGITERPTLGYRTLSDSIWTYGEIESFENNEDGTFTKVRISGEEASSNVWKNNNLGTEYTLWKASNPANNWYARGVKQGLSVRIYGPEWYNSYNTDLPYGQNDGGLWQGHGYNTALTTGLRLESYGFQLTFKPQLSWSQNQEFEYIKPNYYPRKKNKKIIDTEFSGKADKYGYYGVRYLDAPQRFGDEAFWNFDWGDSEIRYTWNTFTLGFGTQAVWMGPAKLNPIMHSNNAPSYPKIDIGLRKTNIRMPHFGWDLGYIEMHGWWGKLTESDYFDNIEDNDERLITGLTFYYQFPFFKEFTFGINRTMISRFDSLDYYTLFNIYWPFPSSATTGGNDLSDQRFSFTLDYNIKKFGFDIYFEWARNDFSTDLDYYVRYPFHTQAWELGFAKSFCLFNKLNGEINFEVSFLEISPDYYEILAYQTTFYSHGKVKQGYTNRGQWIGSGIGTGGNSQYLGVKFYYAKGYLQLFGQRRNPDLDYTMFIDSHINKGDALYFVRTNLDFGLRSLFFINKSSQIEGAFIYDLNYNPTIKAPDAYKMNNYVFNLKIKYNF